jgi:histidinol dehydrogenase
LPLWLTAPETVPRVDKIVGPGNQYVAAAKALVATDCAIDFYAGPTEIVIVSDKGNPEWIAADLIAQAEHDPQARALLITTSRRLAKQVDRWVTAQLPKEGPARESLARHGGIIIAASREEAAALANRAAPEHLVCDDDSFAAACVRPERYSWGPIPHRLRATTRSARITSCQPTVRHDSVVGLHTADFVRVSTISA